MPLGYALIFKGDHLSAVLWLGVVVATLGGFLASGPEISQGFPLKPVLLALSAAFFFGSALICYPSFNLDRLGFVDGVHFLSCTPEDFGDVARGAMETRGRTDKLRAAASQMVLNLHTNETRAIDVLRCLTLAARNELKGAKYADGDLQSW